MWTGQRVALTVFWLAVALGVLNGPWVFFSRMSFNEENEQRETKVERKGQNAKRVRSKSKMKKGEQETKRRSSFNRRRPAADRRLLRSA